MTLKHIKSVIAFHLMQLPMSGRHRKLFARWGGVRVKGKCFIGQGVTFDTVYPENITIGNGVHITSGCTLLTHYLDTQSNDIDWLSGKIVIGDRAFIGTNTIIAKPCHIGHHAIVGAGSVVTKDIPANEIWAGNPARFIKKRN